MLIVAGNLYVHPEDRDKWIQAHHEIVKIALRAWVHRPLHLR
jgi:hypothetical protein